MKIRVTIEEMSQNEVRKRQVAYNGRAAEIARQQLNNMIELLEGNEKTRRSQRDIRGEILDALSLLGIIAGSVEIVPCGADRAVYVNEEYFGVWDGRKKTFVD